MFLATFFVTLLCVPSVSFAASGSPGMDHAQLAMALALLISEALPLLPGRAKGILHGAILLTRAILENVK